MLRFSARPVAVSLVWLASIFAISLSSGCGDAASNNAVANKPANNVNHAANTANISEDSDTQHACTAGPCSTSHHLESVQVQPRYGGRVRLSANKHKHTSKLYRL